MDELRAYVDALFAHRGDTPENRDLKEEIYGNLVTDAFGVVAMVAMTPLVTIQLLGLSYQRKLRRAPAPAAPVAVEELIELC